MANELTRHKRSDTVKWVIIFLLVIGIIGAVVAVCADGQADDGDGTRPRGVYDRRAR